MEPRNPDFPYEAYPKFFLCSSVKTPHIVQEYYNYKSLENSIIINVCLLGLSIKGMESSWSSVFV